MKSRLIFGAIIFITAVIFLSSFQKNGQKEPWTEKQLMATAELAEKLTSGMTTGTYIFNIGPSGKIKNCITIGPTQEAENMARLKKQLAKIPKGSEIVIYCGCCPFENCPNIRPAFELLNEMKFTNARLLNIPKNLKVNWIDKGYPMQN